jgi:molybdopterin-containing oxidoreductase family iron-sulfur binding subunit
LVDAISAGSVETLLILDANAAYSAPADVDFVAALGRVAVTISSSLYLDETARRCRWHVPMAHYLESWGDVRASDGTISIQQPLVAPLYGGRSCIELLAILTRDSRAEGEQIVRRALANVLPDESAWRRALHDGVVAESAWPPVSRTLLPQAGMLLSAEEKSGVALDNGQLELTLAPDPRVFDGRFANNGWLQELPESASKLTWDNALMLSPRTGKELGLRDGGLARLSLGEASLTVPVLFVPGQGPGALKLYLGHGRTAAGRVGGQDQGDERAEPVGVNAYALRTRSHAGFVRGARVEALSGRASLATTQDKHTMDRIGTFGTADRLPMLVREAKLAEYREHPDFAAHKVHHPPLLSLWKEPVKYEGHKWGMSIDLNKCTGCNGCVVACQSEKNIPVVGKERVAMGREMHWIRVDRYFQGDPEQPETAHQPVPCMHCEHAPCEQVCPVGATVHSSEGLNEMTYNRCIGTRYCSNNCPYKVRRFNYFNFHEDMKEEKNQVKGMVFNPEVTVRFRGVMEKCSYCVQRIQEGKFKAGRDNRPLTDGEITTACQDSCPTQAIVFGDLQDAGSAVSARKRDPRDYSLLEELNVRPRTTYLARVKNPHPELG